MTVFDIGAGSGLFSAKVLQVVPVQKICSARRIIGHARASSRSSPDKRGFGVPACGDGGGSAWACSLLTSLGAEVTLTSTCNITGIPVGRNFRRSAYVEIGLARTCCAFAGGDSTASNRIVPAHLACLTTELAPNPGLRPWSGLQRPQIFETLYQIVSQSRDQRSRYKFAFFRNKPDTPVPYTPSAKCRHHDITQGEAS